MPGLGLNRVLDFGVPAALVQQAFERTVRDCRMWKYFPRFPLHSPWTNGVVSRGLIFAINRGTEFLRILNNDV